MAPDPSRADVAPHGPGLADVAPHGPGHADVVPHGPGLADVAPHGPGLADVVPHESEMSEIACELATAKAELALWGAERTHHDAELAELKAELAAREAELEGSKAGWKAHAVSFEHYQRDALLRSRKAEKRQRELDSSAWQVRVLLERQQRICKGIQLQAYATADELQQLAQRAEPGQERDHLLEIVLQVTSILLGSC